ncbi:DMT family transporter [Methylovirgula sp. 4M-Z18]|uniref:DMT family transporter n=1 Tax=Methylovirgula sp. 4M-Z18 TaxID=2293567 RepID=UPI000E2E5F7B|nr:DMT family transporter [Methylovirgula sp. 4M-Z18]RFB78103.1 DMT family transporter [Methylovirgula sp. 4M-Z18]
MPIGILAGLLTCALWGLTFVAPLIVAPYTPWDLTIARYGIFGALSLLLLAFRPFRQGPWTLPRLVTALLLGGLCYVGYFVSAAFAVRFAGAAIPPLIIGLMPVTLAAIANLQERKLPWRRLSVPLAMILTGLLIVNLSALWTAPPAGRGERWLGILCAAASLLIWIVYGQVNASALRRRQSPSVLSWTCVQGIGAGLGSLTLLPVSSFVTAQHFAPDTSVRFWSWALIMGVAASWLAAYCWAEASRRLPLVLASQLIVAETVFGLAYGFVYAMRWPTPMEASGALLQVVGVCLAIALLAKQERLANAGSTPRNPLLAE